MEELSSCVKRHHVSLSCNSLALCWVSGVLRQSCTVSAAISPWSAVQLSCPAFKRALWDTVPRPHGVPHCGDRVWTKSTTWRGGGELEHTDLCLSKTISLYIKKKKINKNQHVMLGGRNGQLWDTGASFLSRSTFPDSILRPAVPYSWSARCSAAWKPRATGQIEFVWPETLSARTLTHCHLTLQFPWT